MIENALKLARMGFHIFPLRENSKLPLVKNFPNVATTDEDQIKKWWTCPVTGIEKNYNIGISTTKFRTNGALVVVDVDNKNDKKGGETLLKLEMDGKELPGTFEQSTTTKGQHLVFFHSEAVKQGVDVLGKGLDIRSRGGFIVGAGSVIDGKEYKSNWNQEISQCPQWVIEECGKAIEPTEDKKKGKKYQATEFDIERAIYYLENEAPESIKGEGGDQTAYRVAARVKDFGISKEHCLDLMLDHWFEGSGWTAEKLKVKIDHAYHYGKEAVGASTPAAAFEAIQTPANEDSEHYLKRLNREYALVYVGGSHSILHETIDEKGRAIVSLMSELTFKRKFSPYTVQKGMTYAEEWLDWANRREYKGLCFAPEREPRNGYYNTWKGFTCKPLPYEEGSDTAKRGLDMFLEHALENICENDKELFNWLIGYFAHMIQRPYERPLTTVAFQGGKGVGKNALVDRIGNLLGNGHYLVAHDGRYLTSNFNGHMDSCLCLVLDEAFWSGDKSAEGKLKGITTAPEIVIERKGKEAYTVDNLVRVIIIGNEDWLVPASADERRYAVFAVGDGKKQQTEYFREMREAIDLHGGNSLLLHYLQNFDLSKVDLNVAPKTQALLEQKVNSMEPFEKFWLHCLIEGEIPAGDFSGSWQKEVSKKQIRAAFTKYCKDLNIRSRLPDERAIGRMLKKVCPPSHGSAKIKIGEERLNAYKLPELAVARLEWEKTMGQKGEWETTSIFD